MAISIAIYTPRLVNPITQFVFWIHFFMFWIFFCVSPHWLVTWHCMCSRLYHIMIFIKLNDMFTQKNLIVTRNVSLNLLFLKQSSWSNIKNLRTSVWQWSPTWGNIFAYTFFPSERYIQLAILMIICVKSTKESMWICYAVKPWMYCVHDFAGWSIHKLIKFLVFMAHVKT